MKSRTFALPLAALTSLAIVVAACGPGAATSAPGSSQGAAATVAPVTQAPAGTDGAAPTLDLSSFHADVQLEDLFPDEIGGQTLTVLSMSGAEFMVGGTSPELEATLTALGKSPSDLTVAFGGVTNVSIIAFQIAGVPGGSILTEFFKKFQQETPSVITDVTISGKSVKKIVPTDTGEETTYVYTSQDVVFAVGGADITDALLAEVFSKLP
ncbi:MAG: hypothetical protein ABIZ52_07850 [Candidatus Limnocylindrales bacterium]